MTSDGDRIEPAPEDDRPAFGELAEFPMPPRRWSTTAVGVLAALLIAFGGGYVFGHSKGQADIFQKSRIAPLHGDNGALAVLRIARADSSGNTPLELAVTGLPAQRARRAFYALRTTIGHQPSTVCGTFRMRGSTTTVRFTIPFSLIGVDGWVVTAQSGAATPAGRTVLST